MAQQHHDWVPFFQELAAKIGTFKNQRDLFNKKFAKAYNNFVKILRLGETKRQKMIHY